MKFLPCVGNQLLAVVSEGGTVTNCYDYQEPAQKQSEAYQQHRAEHGRGHFVDVDKGIRAAGPFDHRTKGINGLRVKLRV